MEFILLGLCDNTGPVLDADALTVYLIFTILSVKKEANSLQACELLLFLAIMSVKKDSLAFLSSKL